MLFGEIIPRASEEQAIWNKINGIRKEMKSLIDSGVSLSDERLVAYSNEIELLGLRLTDMRKNLFPSKQTVGM